MKTLSNKLIHRKLATRLAIVAFIISAVLGVIVILVDRGKVGEVVLDRATAGNCTLQCTGLCLC